MSDRMKAIKRHLAEKRAVRKAAGGVWVRRGECKRCGQCCNIRLVAPEQYERVQEEARASGQIPENAVLDPVCANYHRQPDGRMGCDLHETAAYPAGCRAFPSNPRQWYLVMEHCGYEFVWVEDEPRKAGKERRRRK